MARQMKDSGIEWIGEIPQTWSLRRLRFLCDISTGNQDTQDNDPDGEYPFYVRSPIVERSLKYTFEGPAILMAGDGVGAGKVFHYVDGKYGCHQRVYSMQHIRDVHRKFLFYYLQNRFVISIETANSKSTVDSVRLPMLQDFPVTMPSLAEQQRIADFLDRKCAEIDAVIERTKATIEEYKKLKQAVITEAVTKGVRGPRPMKDSGIEWIGEIPEEWEVRKLKYVSTILRGGSPRPIDAYLTDSPDGYNWIKIGDTTKGYKYIDGTKQKITPDGATKSRMVHKGDLLLTNSMSFGEPYILNVDGCIHDGWVAFSDYHGVDIEYLYYFLSSAFCLLQFQKQVDGGVVQNLNIDKIGSTFIMLPFLGEQHEIVVYLDEKCTALDTLIAKKAALLTELETYKKSLIYEYVTGKKEV